MKFNPYAYQEFAIRFIREHPQAMLLLDMGLGKTIITLTAIVEMMLESSEIRKVLVVAPLRVARTVWPKEKDLWDHTSLLRMSVLTGTAKQRAVALNESADVYVINRENVKWLVDHLEQNGRSWPFDMLVIDELSSFKNHMSQRWRALWKVRPRIRRIVGLTGTPTGNGLLDLWAETTLIDRGRRFGSFSRFRDTWFHPASVDPWTGMIYSYAPNPGAEKAIYRKLRDLSVSMRAGDHLVMPECLSVTHEVEMDPGEQKIYDAMKEGLLVEVGEDILTAKSAASLTGKLLQMANGAVYSDEGETILLHDRKLEALEDLLEQANGQNVLIAYWYRHDHDRIRERLKKAGYHPRDLKTDQDITDWNDGKIPVALISPASAGHGLNIQRGGHILIWFSLVWSLELYAQTNARLWRQGQKEVVTIHHIVTRGTVDEAVFSALKRKDTTQQNLITAVKAQLEGGQTHE